MLGDPNFERTVVLMVEHNDDGALGIVLNRPTDLPLLDALPDWAGLASAPAVLHVGGPVQERTGWCLARPRHPAAIEALHPPVADLGPLDPEPAPADLPSSLRLPTPSPATPPPGPAHPHADPRP